ncbi:hypothetical protein ES332_A10G154700v1 [Gossypium tomentosum]|uniref:Uncharacterized protein n=1 Tax=Gossypium tomentosum TaxID=34277 RepID=A0A5D2NQ98_GOSTO|nr:hypothetical protein ES332_A10G154700v1 [Gossypium tomentosum]
MCGLLPKSPSAASSITDGGIIWVSEWNVLQQPLVCIMREIHIGSRDNLMQAEIII